MATQIKIDVDLEGPLFRTAHAQRVMRDFLDGAKLKVAQVGVNDIHARLGTVLKHPTGRYSSGIVTDRAQRFNDQVITDGGIVYGPWLEGTSRRNQTTRFKGYKTFRRVRYSLRKKVTQIVQDDLNRAVARLQ